MDASAAQMFLVQGITGEFSDFNEWTVGVFDSGRLAEEWARRANAWLKNRGLHHDDPYGFSYANPHPEASFDKALRVDYTGAQYAVTALPVITSIPWTLYGEES